MFDGVDVDVGVEVDVDVDVVGLGWRRVLGLICEGVEGLWLGLSVPESWCTIPMKRSSAQRQVVLASVQELLKLGACGGGR